MNTQHRTRRRVLHVGLAAAALLVIDAQPALAAELRNGGFETGGFGPWDRLSDAVDGAQARWTVTDEEVAPISGAPIPPPPEGEFQAVADQNEPGFNILYQDFDLGTDDETLTMTLWYSNYAEEFRTPRSFEFEDIRNQQLRIDLMKAGTSVRSLNPENILATLYRTRKGDEPFLEPTELSFDISRFQGRKVRLRIAQVATDFFFNVGVDAVSVGPAAVLRTATTRPVGTSTAPAALPGGRW